MCQHFIFYNVGAVKFAQNMVKLLERNFGERDIGFEFKDRNCGVAECGEIYVV